MSNNSGLARAFWVVEKGRGEIRAEAVPEPAVHEVLVRTLFTGISRGTEALVFAGSVPTSEFTRMRAPFQAGDFPAPVKYGYINVGRVERGPAALVGHVVFCLYPHQTQYVVPFEAVHLLPESVPASRGILAAYMETAVNGLWDANPKVGDRIAVVGAGTVGCLAAWLAAGIRGCTVELIDIDPGKAKIAQALNIPFASPENASPEADIVIHTSATADGLATALRLAAFEAAVVELSWFGDRMPAVALGEAFHSRRLTLRSSQVGSVATTQRSRWSTGRRMELALRLLGDSVLDNLISGESRFEELPALMATITTRPAGTLCHRIVYET